MESVDKHAKVAKIQEEQKNKEQAKNLKIELDFKNSQVCNHLVSSIATFKNTKRAAPAPPPNNNQAQNEPPQTPFSPKNGGKDSADREKRKEE